MTRCHLIEAFFSLATMIQASISVQLLSTFKHLLSEGSDYAFSFFWWSNPNFCFTESPHAIRFIDQTCFVELAETFEPIPREGFTCLYPGTKQLNGVIQRDYWISSTDLPGLNSFPSFYTFAYIHFVDVVGKVRGLELLTMRD